MSRENLERIFEPFQSGARGTGLGLSIVHKIVTDLGGRINVESALGKGTKITLDLLK
jgi:signal transduction histidine kinase